MQIASRQDLRGDKDIVINNRINRLVRIVPAVPLILVLLAATAMAKEPELPTEGKVSPRDCLECHEETWKEATARLYVHAPFREKKCVACHAADTPMDPEDPEGGNLSPEIRDWTGKSLTPATSHWFEFSPVGRNATMILEATYGSLVRLYREIPIPPLDDLPDMAAVYGDEPPAIENVEILAVEKGVFLTATIAWQTNRPTTSTITYGIEEPRQQTIKDIRLLTDHRQTLSDLQEGKTYRFRITAEDSVGNTVKSEQYEFNTAERFSSPGKAKISEKCCLATPLGLESRFYRKDDRYLINITLAQPVKLFFKVTDQDRPGMDTSEEPVPADDGPDDTKHVVVNEKKIISLLICKKCHPNLSGHHPVNVFPKGEMVIPADYPTLDDGRVSCISCHAPHAGNLPFLVIKDHRQELCIGCHSGLGAGRDDRPGGR